VASLRRYRRLTGEGLTFGIPDGMVVPFLTERGFAQVRCVRSEDLRRMYFTGKRQGRRVASGHGIVSAVVP
jgi:O-methyltransferase involved in polyketide biosynthesis